MKQLVNFIPRTAAECRALLSWLSESEGGVSVTDRYGNTHELNTDETKELISLIESQIGEKAPLAGSNPEEVKSPVSDEKPREKAGNKARTKKSAKK